MTASARGRSSASTRLWLVVVLVACIHLVCYRAASPLRRQVALLANSAPNAAAGLVKRTLMDDGGGTGGGDVEDGGSLIDWKGIWEGATTQQRPFLFAGMVLWLMFLFAFVGITASDFFCPNLSTIASRLGMSESVAGVTFLAFSNGSPDVFSTFAALSHDSGSLAIGELIGAASFIVSVVAGTMCLIKPFRVAKHTFLRDVGFFTIAVSFTLGILYDSHIHLWEALGMVGLYLIYVMVVAVGSWWMSRKEKREALIRAARDEYAEDSRGYHDDEAEDALAVPPAGGSGRSTPHSHHTTTAGAPTFPFPTPGGTATPYSPTLSAHPHMHQSLDEDSFFAAAERGTPVTLTRSRSGSLARPQNRRAKTRSTVRPSLLGAIEFRDVVNSLREDSSARTLAVFGGLGDEPHTHATLVGPEGSVHPKLPGGRQRALSHSGAMTLDGVQGASAEEQEANRPPLASNTPGGARRTTWTAQPGGVEAQTPWNQLDEGEEDERGRHSPLIDLSEGVENPWHGSHSRAHSRTSLHVDIPPSSAASTRIRSNPPSVLRRTNSGHSIDADGKRIRKVPSILLTSASGDDVLVQPSATISGGRFGVTHRRSYRIARAVFLALFPSLQDFREKSWVGRATAILCVPAILVLNLTLPVVDSEADDCVSQEEKEALEDGDSEDGYRDYDSEDEHDGPREGILVDTGAHQHAPTYHSHNDTDRSHREQVARALHDRVLPHADFVEHIDSPWATPLPTPLPDGHGDVHESFARFSMASENGTANHVRTSTEGTEETSKTGSQVSLAHLEVHANVLTRWLTAVQCTLGPVFCVTALMIEDLRWWYPVVALAGGLVIASFAFYLFEHPTHRGRIVLCFVGFFVAMVWILMIVNEVVGVLQTIGHIFGLSDAILGLTVFAVGNSLGDLVANATVARMGFPSMAIAACFGGPMLNILLGIGLSGSYMVISNDYKPLHVKMGRTLLVSGIGLLVILLSTLILVPMNGYWMNKKLGAGLILAYTCVLSINVAVEIFL